MEFKEYEGQKYVLIVAKASWYNCTTGKRAPAEIQHVLGF